MGSASHSLGGDSPYLFLDHLPCALNDGGQTRLTPVQPMPSTSSISVCASAERRPSLQVEQALRFLRLPRTTVDLRLRPYPSCSRDNKETEGAPHSCA